MIYFDHSLRRVDGIIQTMTIERKLRHSPNRGSAAAAVTSAAIAAAVIFGVREGISNQKNSTPEVRPVASGEIYDPNGAVFELDDWKVGLISWAEIPSEEDPNSKVVIISARARNISGEDLIASNTFNKILAGGPFKLQITGEGKLAPVSLVVKEDVGKDRDEFSKVESMGYTDVFLAAEVPQDLNEYSLVIDEDFGVVETENGAVGGGAAKSIRIRKGQVADLDSVLANQ